MVAWMVVDCGGSGAAVGAKVGESVDGALRLAEAARACLQEVAGHGEGPTLGGELEALANEAERYSTKWSRLGIRSLQAVSAGHG